MELFAGSLVGVLASQDVWATSGGCNLTLRGANIPWHPVATPTLWNNV